MKSKQLLIVNSENEYPQKQCRGVLHTPECTNYTGGCFQGVCDTPLQVIW